MKNTIEIDLDVFLETFDEIMENSSDEILIITKNQKPYRVLLPEYYFKEMKKSHERHTRDYIKLISDE